MTKPRRPKWIQTQYDIIEQQNKYQKHKLTKREFMKGFKNEESRNGRKEEENDIS